MALIDALRKTQSEMSREVTVEEILTALKQAVDTKITREEATALISRLMEHQHPKILNKLLNYVTKEQFFFLLKEHLDVDGEGLQLLQSNGKLIIQIEKVAEKVAKVMYTGGKANIKMEQMRTDESNTLKFLAPNGSGGVFWNSVTNLLPDIGTGGTAPKVTWDTKGRVISGGNLSASDIPTGIDASKIATGIVSNTEFEYLNNLTGNIQTQLDSKTPLTTTATISGGLNTRLTTVENNYATKSTPTAGTYNNVTINSQGIVTDGSNVTYTVPNDLNAYTLLTTTATISGGLNTRLTTVEGNYATKATPTSGTYNNVTVNGQGIVTAGSNVTYTVPNDLNAYTLLTTTASISGNLQTQIDNKVSTSLLGAANGVATLDTNSKLTASQLPASIVGGLSYQSTWNANTNTPTLPTPDQSNNGFYWKVSVAGTYNSVSYDIGDWIISNGASYEKIDNSDSVFTVFNRTGNIVAQSGDYTASQITSTAYGDVEATNVQSAIQELSDEKALKTFNIIAGTGLTGGGNLTANNRTIALADTTVTAGTYGDSGANIPNITVDAKGRLTAATNRALTASDVGAASSSHNHDTTYLGINAKAADSDKLDGNDSTYFATATHNHDTTYLGINAKAADSDKLDGNDSTYFATATHNHDTEYLKLSGGTLTGDLTAPNVITTTWHYFGTKDAVGSWRFGLDSGNMVLQKCLTAATYTTQHTFGA